MIMPIIYFEQFIVICVDGSSASTVCFYTNPTTFGVPADVATVSVISIHLVLENWSSLLRYTEL